MVAGARRLHVEEIGISDHLTLHPRGADVSWSMRPQAVSRYVEESLDAARRSRRAGGPTVRLGLEVDWFASEAALIRRTLEPLPLDFVIGSVHFDGDTELDGRPSVWEAWSVDERERVHRDYWRNMGEMAASGLFDVVGHLDLTKKFGFRPTRPLDDVIAATLDAIAAADMVVELNTNGWHCPCAEAYPSPSLLVECRRREIPVTISADAHHPDHLLRDFRRAADALRAAGYDRLARFDGRRRYLEPIASAVPGTS